LPGTLDLEISDPVLVLNEVARRYETTERVLMEYVDNALDDAEALYRDNGDRYPYPIHIEITVDLAASQVVIRDNCQGMSRQLLERVVKNIGESQKRGVTWVNGRFGFGVQAFRAAAQHIRFETKQKNSSYHSLELDRNQHRGIKEAHRSDDPFPTDTGTGSIIIITGFDPAWSNFSAASIRAEIEAHFERLIARPGLSIVVGEAGQTAESCRPFDYELIEGESIRETLVVTHRDELYPIEVYLKAAQEKMAGRSAGFFARGRRINDVIEIKSFMRKSKFKTGLWGHPHVVGYIEVGEIVQPAITRDDFDRTRGRQTCYEAILALEPKLKTLIGRINKAGKKKTLTTLENVVSEAAANAVRFAAPPPESADTGKRTYRAGEAIVINPDHPDFKERLAYTRQGQPRITDRLNAYLAGVISLNYPERFMDLAADPAAAFEAQLDFMFKLEATLRKQQAALERELTNQPG
jgi:hypothetical protein